ncbi:hypothetical protein GF340_05990 [Candidatus Peregrinibacteria bacterium]|nr:hypothetical protein [Candidatus Peregrinibacteria bacterium]
MKKIKNIDTGDSGKDKMKELHSTLNDVPLKKYQAHVRTLLIGSAIGAIAGVVSMYEENERNITQQGCFTEENTYEAAKINVPEDFQGSTELNINTEGDNLLLLISDYEKNGNLSLAEHLRNVIDKVSVMVKCPSEETLQDKELALKMVLALDLMRLISEQNPTDVVTKSYVKRHQYHLQKLLNYKVRLNDVPSDTMLLVRSLEIANMDSCEEKSRFLASKSY